MLERSTRLVLKCCLPFAAVVAMCTCTGCKQNLRDRKHISFLTDQDAAAYVAEVQKSPNPDRRRLAVNRLARSRYLNDPPVIDALALAARTDPSQSVRAAATLALGKTTTDVACAAFLDILQEGSEHPGAATADENVRAASVRGLLHLAEMDRCPADRRDQIAETGIRLLRSDRSRNVRLAAAQLLGHFPDSNVLDVLVQALDQRDFGICYEAERSLMRLTGRSFDHDARAWRDFLAGSDDPYADRGKLDDRLTPARRSWFGQPKGS